MATKVLIADRLAGAISAREYAVVQKALRDLDRELGQVLANRIATFGEVTEENDRIARIEVRPGMTERHPLGLSLRRWGHGHWCVANGNPSFFSHRADAEMAANRWVSEGRSN